MTFISWQEPPAQPAAVPKAGMERACLKAHALFNVSFWMRFLGRFLGWVGEGGAG